MFCGGHYTFAYMLRTCMHFMAHVFWEFIDLRLEFQWLQTAAYDQVKFNSFFVHLLSVAGGNGVGRFKLYMCLRKMCPKCGTIVHVKRAVCSCGHAFALKRKAHCCVGSEPERER